MLEMLQLPFMMQALIACLLLTLVLSYFGVHVVRRGIVFIDLALAQISSAGVAFAVLMDGEPRFYALAFTLIGAVAMAFLPKNPRVPQEAIIGIIYAVASAAAILMLAKSPHGDSDVTAILFGNILAITPEQLMEMGAVFAVVALVHLVFRKQFGALTRSHQHNATVGAASGMSFWNILFYLSLALVISDAIRAAGVLLVFSYLIVPAVSALLMCRNALAVLLSAMALGVVASLSGLYSSYTYDLPTGATIVGCFGVLFAVVLAVSGFRKQENPHADPIASSPSLPDNSPEPA